jgi:hypothetical protein
MKVNDPPKNAAKNTFRSCGGHIHIGYVEGSKNVFLQDIEGKAMTIRVMDAVLGVVATILDNSKPAIERRKLYGKAGCFRPTEYGVEYRTLSNFWIKSPVLVELMYALTEEVISLMNHHLGGELIGEIGPDTLQSVITEGQSEVASKIYEDVLKDYLTDGTKTLVEECIADINQYDFMSEWDRIEVL